MRASMTGEIRGLGAMQNAVMYRSDERVVAHDEPFVFRHAPSVKPEPVSLPSVRVVSSPAKVGDKLPPRRQSVSESFKPTLTPVLNSPPVQRIEP
jgi:hypothetical protein